MYWFILQISLIVVNIICFLAGGAILAGALFIRFEPSINKYTNADGIQVIATELHAASYVLITFGALSFIIGFLGCCGALKENKVQCTVSFRITLHFCGLRNLG